jgi:dTDP-4-dehydrorhamnose reductase
MTILVFGSQGFLGTRFVESFDDAVGSSADIADPSAVAAELERVRPEIVINCAGKTGRPNIDWCEEHRRETLRSNVTGPLVLADACLARSLYFVHLGSGCVYEGDNDGQGFAEEDRPNYSGSFYSLTKAWADEILARFPILILRIRMPFDDTLHARTLLGKLVRYRQVLDAPNSLTYIPDLLAAAAQLIQRRSTGIYHIVNPGVASPYGIMCQYREIVDPQHEITRVTPQQLNSMTLAPRCNCLLATNKLTRLGIHLPTVGQRLDEALRAIGRI